jgi:tetratricopeptide (TPR) repeat protein
MSIASLTPASEFELSIPAPGQMMHKQDLAITKDASARDPHSVSLRNHLADLLIRADEFEEAAARLRASEPTDLRGLLLLQTALLSFRTEPENREAQRLGERAVAVAATPPLRAKALAMLAKAHSRLGDTSGAEVLLERALTENPRNKDAYKRLFAFHLESDPEAALSFALKMMERDVLHACSLGSITLALARLGRMEEARHVEGFDRFFLHHQPDPPPGWATLRGFCDAASAEMLAHPGIRYAGRHGTAARNSWRIEELALPRSVLAPQVQQLIRSEVLRAVAAMPAAGHPFLQARPAKAVLNTWSVITEGDGYEEWHVHDRSWFSGVFYLHVQEHIENGTRPEGCIAFGLPASAIGEESATAFGQRVVRPHTGMLAMFPSHVYHRTYPHRGTGRRIGVGFDVVPARKGA